MMTVNISYFFFIFFTRRPDWFVNCRNCVTGIESRLVNYSLVYLE